MLKEDKLNKELTKGIKASSQLLERKKKVLDQLQKAASTAAHVSEKPGQGLNSDQKIQLNKNRDRAIPAKDVEAAARREAKKTKEEKTEKRTGDSDLSGQKIPLDKNRDRTIPAENAEAAAQREANKTK